MTPSIAPTPSSHFYTSLRTRLHYLDWGNPSAPTLILVHGSFDHARSWDWTARALAQDYHVIAPDLRGHGDSGWSTDGAYMIANFVYDLAQLVDIHGRSPVMIVGHSLGGSVSLRYAGLYPEKVHRIVAIEGLGLAPALLKDKKEKPLPDEWREWIDKRRMRAAKPPRRYLTIEAAVGRMRERNEHLSVEQALHLTTHGMNRNEDGSYSWKFDPYLNVMAPQAASDMDLLAFWEQIRCPALLCLGKDSWASNPVKDGRIKHFRDARLVEFAHAGHWLHHDQFDRFVSELRAFLEGERFDGRSVVRS
ncbi:alpha/beta fold hydrolase [Sphingobium sp. CCH11-B1]|jgi:pimeloyl-ACP methyl ester carboxylesterase|uniref:alpha/beta fold hydrolase n=1 Tax=Sphingobium sp. CCH11-B1 TaxID=1768781 RepID=UPI000834E41A|nr:alpha/beta hydrolase [Sphingobium sp. CCH11-B1]MEA3387990.1 alpha/beta hydrolase [Pseudomonadota bacterium]